MSSGSHGQRDRLGEIAFRARWIAGTPHHPADAHEEPRPLDVAVDVGQRPEQQLGCLGKALPVLRLGRRLQPDRHRLREPGGREEMPGALARGWVGHGRQRVGRSRMQGLPPRQDDVVVDRLACQGVPELVAAALRVDVEQLLADECHEGRLDGRDLAAADAGQEIRSDRGAQDRGGLEDLDGRLRQPLDALQDRLADRSRQAQLLDLPSLPASRGAVDVAAVDGVLEQLLEHEGVALATLQEQVAELRADDIAGEDRAHHLGHRRGVEWLELDDGGCRTATPALEDRSQGVPPVQLVATVGRQDHGPGRAQATCQEVEQLAGGSIRPVDVLDDEDEPSVGCFCAEQLEDRLEEAQSGHRVVGCGIGRAGIPELREHRRQVDGGWPEPIAHHGRPHAGEVVAEGFDEGQVGQCELRLAAAAPEDDGTHPLGTLHELPREACLAEAGLPGKEHEAPVATQRTEEGVLERVGLPVSPDDGRAEGLLDHRAGWSSVAAVATPAASGGDPAYDPGAQPTTPMRMSGAGRVHPSAVSMARSRSAATRR